MSATRCSDDDRYGRARSWRQQKTNAIDKKIRKVLALKQEKICEGGLGSHVL